MSNPDGDPPRPRRVFDLDTLVDCAGLCLAVPLIVFITWLILNPTHFSLWFTGRRVDELLTAAVLDALLLVILVGGILLLRCPPTGIIWKVLTLSILVSLCAGGCWLSAELLNYWSQLK
jgi:hypothetical protein